MLMMMCSNATGNSNKAVLDGMSNVETAMASSWMIRNVSFDSDGRNQTALLPHHSSLEQWRMYERQQSSELATFWQTAVPDVDASVRDRWFDKLVNLHSESTRHYHTLVHLQEMLGYYRLLINQAGGGEFDSSATLALRDRQCMLLSIFFHDAIYDVHSSTNEADSARLFQEFAAEAALDESIMQDVVTAILATQSHVLPSSHHHHPIWMVLLLDMDLAVLAKQPAAYNHYAALIRREYAHVPHETYCATRASILESLAQKRIYGHAYFVNTLEEQARFNLQREVELLRRFEIPQNAHAGRATAEWMPITPDSATPTRK